MELRPEMVIKNYTDGSRYEGG